MTENKAVETLEYIKTFDGMDFGATKIALDMAIQTLAEIQQYRAIENRLKEVYGECDGLLEIVVNSLLDYDNAPDKAIKAVLLTDEDVDKWEAYTVGWTPCSERLPKELKTKDGHIDPSEEVLVYIYYGKNCVSNGYAVSRYWSHSENHPNPWIDLKFGSENVIAWKPIEPYQPKGE